MSFFDSLSFKNHMRLVNRVYPARPTEKSVPRPNKLSSLMFYASSKPGKLVKVGAYLELKVTNDVHWKRHGHCKISIDIMNALLQECSQYIHIFGINVLRSLVTLMALDRPIVITGCANVFIRLCELYEETGGHDIEADFLQPYNTLTRLFQEKSRTETVLNKDFQMYEMRLASLRAMQAVASIENFLGEGVEERIQCIWFSILDNASQTEDLKVAATEKALRRSAIVPQSNLLDKNEFVFESLSTFASRCLQRLLSKANATSIELVMNPLFSHLDEMDRWRDFEFCVALFENVSTALPVRNRALVAVQFLARLGSKVHQKNGHARSYLKILMKLLETSHISSFPMIELVEALTNLYLIFIQDEQLSGNTDLILKCFEIAGSNKNLNMQLPDGVQFIVEYIKSRPNGQLHEHTKHLLTCLMCMLKHPFSEHSQFVDFIDVMTGLTPVLFDFEQRSMGLLVFYQILRQSLQYCKLDANNEVDQERIGSFRQRVHLTLYKALNADNLTNSDVLLVYFIWTTLLKYFGAKEVTRSVPVLAKLMETHKHVQFSSIQTVITLYFLYAANQFKQADLKSYIVEVRQKCVDDKAWMYWLEDQAKQIDLGADDILKLMKQDETSTTPPMTPKVAQVDRDRALQLLLQIAEISAISGAEQLLRQEFDPNRTLTKTKLERKPSIESSVSVATGPAAGNELPSPTKTGFTKTSIQFVNMDDFKRTLSSAALEEVVMLQTMAQTNQAPAVSPAASVFNYDLDRLANNHAKAQTVNQDIESFLDEL